MIRAPGPAGITVSAGGRVEGVAVTVAGAVESQGVLGDCAQVLRGTLRARRAPRSSAAPGRPSRPPAATSRLAGVDAQGGAAGCLVLVNGASAALEGNLCAGRGPGLVAASGARATAAANRWWTDPVLWVDCGSGARVTWARGDGPAALRRRPAPATLGSALDNRGGA